MIERFEAMVFCREGRRRCGFLANWFFVRIDGCDSLHELIEGRKSNAAAERQETGERDLFASGLIGYWAWSRHAGGQNAYPVTVRRMEANKRHSKEARNLRRKDKFGALPRELKFGSPFSALANNLADLRDWFYRYTLNVFVLRAQ